MTTLGFRLVGYFPNDLEETQETRRKAEEALAKSKEAIEMLKNRSSNQALEEADFDPIDSIVTQIKHVDELIHQELLRGGGARAKLLADLISVRARLAESLMPYGYSKTPTPTEAPRQREPLQIILSMPEE